MDLRRREQEKAAQNILYATLLASTQTEWKRLWRTDLGFPLQPVPSLVGVTPSAEAGTCRGGTLTFWQIPSAGGRDRPASVVRRAALLGLGERGSVGKCRATSHRFQGPRGQ